MNTEINPAELTYDPDAQPSRTDSASTSTEKTGSQAGGLWSRFGYGGSFWNGQSDPLEKAQRASGADQGLNDYDLPANRPGAIPVGGPLAPQPLASVVVPLTLQLYRVMCLDPTISIAEASIVLTIMAAETVVVVDDELTDDPVAQRCRAILDLEIVRKRADLLAGGLQCLRYGWKDFEVVYGEKNDIVLGKYVGVVKFKELNGENIRPRFDPRTGEWMATACAGTVLDTPYVLHIVEGSEDGSYFGVSRNERARRAYFNELATDDKIIRLMERAAGRVPYIGVPPETVENKRKGLTPNMNMALAMVRGFIGGKGAAYYQTAQLDPVKDLQTRPDTAEKKLVDVDFVDVGNPGPAMSSMTTYKTECQKLKLRAWTRPERSITEATTAGSRADSESHGDVAASDAEATHERIWRQVDDQTGARLVEENGGPEYVGRIRIQAVPLQDARKNALAEYHDKLLEDPAFRAAEIKALGSEGVEGLVSKLGLDIKMQPGKFEYVPMQPQPGQTSTPSPGQADKTAPPRDDGKDDDREDLSAALVVDDLADLFPGS